MLIPITDPAIARNRISKAPTPFELKCLRLGQAKYYRGRLIPIMSGGGFPGGGIGGTGSTGSFWVFDLVGSYGLNLTNSAATNYGIINNLLTLANNAAQPGGANPTQFRSVFYIKGATDIYPTSKITFPMIPISFVGDGPTDSILGTTDGTILTYNPNLGIPAGATQPFSYLYGTQAGKGVAYQNNVWKLHNLQFTKTDGWAGNTGNGLDFPQYVSTDPRAKLLLWMEDVVVSNFQGTSQTHAGISNFMSGGVMNNKYLRVQAASCAIWGWNCGGDSFFHDCTAHDCGQEGFRNGSYTQTILGFNSWNNGQLHTAGNMSGMIFQGNPAGGTIAGLELQDNNGPGLTIKGVASGWKFSLVNCDRNCWTENNNGVFFDDSGGAITACSVTGINATDSASASKTNVQLHMVKTTNSSGANAGNKVEGNQFQYSGGRTVTNPVDPASDTNGYNVEVGGMAGGEVAVAFVAAGFTPPGPYSARTQVVGTLTANMTGNIAVPQYSHKGARMSFKFLQDGTGGRTISWAAGYKTNFNTTGNTLGKSTIVDFECLDDAGTTWLQVNNNVWS